MKSIHIYINAFESIALYIFDATDSELLHAFVWGLRDSKKYEVRHRDPKTLTEVEKMALYIEEPETHTELIALCAAAW